MISHLFMLLCTIEPLIKDTIEKNLNFLGPFLFHLAVLIVKNLLFRSWNLTKRDKRSDRENNLSI